MTKRLYNGSETVKDKVAAYVKRARSDVFVPGDFVGIASYPQVLRALKQLVREKTIVRFGHGAYARAEEFNGRAYPVADNPVLLVGLWKKLGIKWELSKAVRDYNSGESTQVPVRGYFVVKGRFSRKFNGAEDLYVAG